MTTQVRVKQNDGLGVCSCCEDPLTYMSNSTQDLCVEHRMHVNVCPRTHIMCLSILVQLKGVDFK